MQYGDRRFQWIFLLADVGFPIIGADFLRHHCFLVDVANQKLAAPGSAHSLQLVAGAGSGLPGAASRSPAICGTVLTAGAHGEVSAAEEKAPSGSSAAGTTPTRGALFAQLGAMFPEVFNMSQVLPATKHEVEHHLVTFGPPITSKFRRLDVEKLAAAKKEFDKMENEGIVRRSTSPWSSPLHMVQKPDGSWRPCGDFCRLNLVTEMDTYPLPNMLDFSARVAGCSVFSKIDLRKGYHQTCRKDIHTVHLSQDPCFSPCRVVMGSGTGIPVWFGKGRKKREFALRPRHFCFFLACFFFELPRSFLLCARKRESAVTRICP
jgi:hypothetical protein